MTELEVKEEEDKPFKCKQCKEVCLLLNVPSYISFCSFGTIMKILATKRKFCNFSFKFD